MKSNLIALFMSLIIVSSVEASENVYQNNLDLRAKNKVGAGASIGGPLGLAGLIVELNLESENSVITGLGTGPGYNSYLLGWKKTFEGTYVTPYVNVGLSYWFGTESSGNLSESTILNQVLTDSEKKSGRFGKNFLSGSLGLQYNHLQGMLSGLSFFIAFDILNTWRNDQIIPSGSVGSIYYF